MKNILIIIGSPKQNSFNKAFSAQALPYLKEARVQYLDYYDLPFITPDMPTPESVKTVYDAVDAADGLWIFASEYNLSYAPQLKNLLDWLSLPCGDSFEEGTHVMGKRVCLTSVAGSSGGRFVLTKLCELTQFIGMDLMRDPMVGVTLEKNDFAEDIPHFQKHDLSALKKEAEQFLQYLEA